MMTEKTRDKNLDALNTSIEKSRAEIATLAAELKRLAHHVPGNGIGAAETGGWMNWQHRLDQAGSRGKQVAQSVADEIVRHPLLSGAAAFGLGFVLARLMFRRSN